MRAPRHAVIAVSAWRDPATGAEFHNWVRCATGGPSKPHSHFLFMPQRHFITQKISTKIPALELYDELIFAHCNSADDCSGYWKTISAR